MNVENIPMFGRIRLPQTRWKRWFVMVIMAMLTVVAVSLFDGLYVGGEWHKFTISEKVMAGVFFAVIWPIWLGGGIASIAYPQVVPIVLLLGLVVAGLFWATVFQLCAIVKKHVSTLAAFSLLVLICAVDLLATSGFHRVYAFSPTNACVNNLRIIDAAKQQWALENNKTANDTPTWADILPFLGSPGKTTSIPKCPEGGQYILGKIGEEPKCSIGDYHSLSPPSN